MYYLESEIIRILFYFIIINQSLHPGHPDHPDHPNHPDHPGHPDHPDNPSYQLTIILRDLLIFQGPNYNSIKYFVENIS